MRRMEKLQPQKRRRKQKHRKWNNCNHEKHRRGTEAQKKYYRVLVFCRESCEKPKVVILFWEDTITLASVIV